MLEGKWLTLLCVCVINPVAILALEYIGCFEERSKHALPYSMGGVANITECIDLCRHNDLLYAGLQNGGECYCGSDFGKYGKSVNCKDKCRSGETCGGGHKANSVYKVGKPDSPAIYEFLGCYQDNRKSAIERNLATVNNVEMCLEICRQNGFPYAGLQAGKVCYCGTGYDKYGKSHTCNMKCRSNEICGGRNSNSVYKIGKKRKNPVFQKAIDRFEYVGCYRDKIFRAIKHYQGNVNSIDECLSRCKRMREPYAGLEYSKECYCGTDYGKYGKSIHCTMTCRSGEICGGNWAISVYRVGKPDCSCSVSGDPHYKTFDGQMIHFMGTCKYTLAMATKEAPQYFAVEVKNEHRGNTRVSYTRMLDVKLPNVTIRLLPGNKLLVNNKMTSPPIENYLGTSVKYSGVWMTVTTNWGLRVQFDGRHRATVDVPGNFSNKLAGICGNCNGKKDDLRTKDGHDVSKDSNRFSKVGKSHQVKDDSDKPETDCDVSDVNTKCPTGQTKRCEVIQHSIFKECSLELGIEKVQEYLESCRIDACIYHNDRKVIDSVVCESIEGFARECEDAGFPIDWRRISNCQMICGPNQVYQFNASVCQASCRKPEMKCDEREEACVCQDGFILSGEDCVPKTECGCFDDISNTYMKAGEEMVDENCQLKTICKPGGTLISEDIASCPVNSECRLENGKNGCWCKEGFIFRNRTCLPVGVCDETPCHNGGECREDGDTFSCICKEPYYGKDCSKKKPDCSCSVSGDPHYKTFDGQMIHFMGTCKYTLAMATKEAPQYFAVEVKNEHRGNTRVSYTRMLDVKLPNVTIRLLPRHKMLVNGEKLSLPINDHLGFSAKFAGGWITVSTEWGLKVQFDGRHRANVKIPATFANKLIGICGDCNGKKDDIRTKDGQDVSKEKDRFSKIGNSHQVKDDSDKPETSCDVSDVNTKCPTGNTKRCEVIQHSIFKECSLELGIEKVQEYLESCRIDACIYHNDRKVIDSVVCESIEGFARECEDAGFPIDWRRISNCRMTCPSNSVYQFNASVCQPSCRETQPNCKGREEACVCKAGYVLSGEECVLKSQCGCYTNGSYMKVNQERTDSNCRQKLMCKAGGKLDVTELSPCPPKSECKIENEQHTCVCQEGFYLHKGTCKKKPDCSCSVSGDPHYKTFDGQMIHFMGTCKYTLAMATKEAPQYFAVEVKNEHRGNTRVSYTRMLDVKLPNVTIRLLPRHKMIVNGETKSVPINDYLGFSAKFAGGWITVSTEWGLKVQFDGRHRANVKIPATFANKLIGICGDCNGKKDDIRTKDGQDVSKEKDRFSKIGNSHQVKDDSDKPEIRCDVTDVVTKCRASQTKRCDVIRHPIFRKCHEKLGTDRLLDYVYSCKIDACAYLKDKITLNEVVCEAIEGFVRECEELGFSIDWRGLSKCEMKCPPNQFYQFNASVCQTSCTDVQENCQEHAEACVCKEGFILSGENCVPKSQCGCLLGGSYMKVNETSLSSTCQVQWTCNEGGKLVTKELPTCEPNSECKVQNGERGCFCKSGFHYHNGKCYPQECEETMADVVFLLDNSLNMIQSGSKNVKQLMKDVVSAFNIGERHVQIGSVSFSHWIEKDFHLNEHSNFTALLDAIDSIKHRERTSFIESALDYLQVTAFNAANGDRAEAPNVAIFITNGNPEMNPKSIRAASSLKDSGVVMFVIAVGNTTRMTDLSKLASKPSSEFVYMLDNFEAINQKVKNTITKRICSVHVCNTKPCKNSGECIPRGKGYICKCKDAFQGKDCSQLKPDCSCSVSGDPHYKTFDGQMIHFMGICKYTLVKSTKDAPHWFAVEVKNEHRGNSRVSYTRMVDIKLEGSVTIRLLKGNQMLVNGEKRSLPINNFLGFSAKYAAGWITVSTEWGLRVQFDGNHRANVKIRATFINKMTGICGDCNGKKDDLRTKDGEDVSRLNDRYSKIGKSHQVEDDSDQPEDKCNVTDVNTKCTRAQTRKCDLITHNIFRECKNRIGDERFQEYLNSCQIDACVYHSDTKIMNSVICRAIEGFVQECQEAGILLQWRKFTNCPMSCPSNQLYKFNALVCQPSCSEPQPTCKEMTEACVCKPGYVLSGKECVLKSQCGCLNHNIYMKVNETMVDSKCQTKTTCKASGTLMIERLAHCQANSECGVLNEQRGCVCKKGFELRQGKCKVQPCFSNPCKNGGSCTAIGDNYDCKCNELYFGKDCSKKKPDCSCSVSGDPHYKTFDGQMIHFMGTCKYTLAMATKEAPQYFAVEVKNEHRGNTRVSYTRMLDVKLPNVTIRLLPRHKMLVNGEKLSLPINNYLGFSAKFAGGWITVSTEWGLKVQFDGRHRANVKIPATFANKLIGICGDCNGKKDDIRTKDGQDVSKEKDRFSKIGNSHQVKDDSDKPEISCDVQDVESKCSSIYTRKCNIIKHNLFVGCRVKIGIEKVQEYLESCRIDACIYHNDRKVIDSVVCESIEGFARECEDAGFPIDWRRISNCPMTCPTNQIYQFNVSACQPSCTEPVSKCNEREEGCVCKSGYILSGEDCVPKSQCGCLYNSIYMKANQQIIDSSCSYKILCKSGGRLIKENIPPCRPHSTCGIEDGQRTCVCDKGFAFRGGKCTKVEPCKENPCKNGGKCTADGLSRTCECKAPYDGDDCSKIAPDCVCSASGDPHYKTFDGQWIHFMGTCKYTLATPKNTSELPYFAVEVKNEHRGNNRVAYTRLVDLKLPGVKIRLLQGNKLMLNGEIMTLPLTEYLGFSAHFSAGWITVLTKNGIKVEFDGRHRVTVKVPNIYRYQLTGICGDCNGKQDDYKTNTGIDLSGKENKFSLLGESYKIFDDTDTSDQQCNVVESLETCSQSETKGCDIMKNPKGPFSVCLAKLGLQINGYYTSCVTDVCAYKNQSQLRDRVLCQAFETLAKACEEINVHVNWRALTKCRMNCPKTKQYSYMTSACQPSCSLPNPTCKEELREGCICKPRTLLSGTDCLPKALCGCNYNGIYIKSGSSVLLTDCSKKVTCKGHGQIEVENGCGNNTVCALQSGTRVCICKEGYLLINGICRKIVAPKPPIIDPEFLGPVLHMFVRVSMAYLEGKSLPYKGPALIATQKADGLKSCAVKCLKTKSCKSFNYDQLESKCKLLALNSENQMLISSDCPYQDFYQLIYSKNISIQGATMLSCQNLETFEKVNSWSECQKLCTERKCKALEYSDLKKICRLTKDNRKSFGLTGDELWKYKEILENEPEMPVNI